MTAPAQPSQISALDEILKWSANRPDWQRDALRRVIANGTITKDDLQELDHLCRIKHSATVPSDPPLAVKPLDSTHIPQGAGSQTSVNLISISDLQGVNRLPPNQSISFGASPGLTVIYGDTGSGKSGYARVFKKACRTRGSLPVIRRDTFAPPDSTPSTGKIVFSTDGEEHTVAWQDGVSSDTRLSHVFVFDSFTAENYLEQDGPATFTPHGLDVLPKLTKVCDAINQRLKQDIESIRSEINSAASGWKYALTTAVGKLIAGLNSKTKESELDALSGLDDVQKKHLHELTETLKSDPKQKARETRASKTRLETFAQKIKTATTDIADEPIAALKALVENAKTTSETAKTFAAAQFGSDDLPGTRNDSWRKLWEAARLFSTSSAYLKMDFPVTEDEARCVLCQQAIGPEAAKRLKAFETFCKDQSQQLAAEAAKCLKDAADKIKLMTPLADEHSKIEADLGTATHEQISSIADFVKKADERLATIKANLTNGVWTSPAAIPGSPADSINLMANALESRAIIEESAHDPLVRKSLEAERDELADRDWLGRLKEEVLTQIDRHKTIAKHEACQKDVLTTGITTKNSELTKLLVTVKFCNRFKTETDTLGLRTLAVKLQEIKGAKGETKFGLRFEAKSQFGVSEVASEGEQRCIALAAFLAELSQASHQSALVFDDPVSSLDHWYRERIAARVVEESKARQVIVFTHDAIFLNDLHTIAEQTGTPAKYHFLDWKGSQPGWCYDGLPWDCKSPEDRLDKLEKRQREIAKFGGVKPSQEDISNIREAYNWLRSTVERIVERVIFADVVFRYRSFVKLKELNRVVGFSQSECDEVTRIFKKCCDVTDAHDPAQGKQAAVPEPKDLQVDINATKQLLASVRARQKAAQSSPPAAMVSETSKCSNIT